MPEILYLVEIDYNPSEHPGACYGWKLINAKTGGTTKTSRGYYYSREDARDGAKSWAWGHLYCEHNQIA